MITVPFYQSKNIWSDALNSTCLTNSGPPSKKGFFILYFVTKYLLPPQNVFLLSNEKVEIEIFCCLLTRWPPSMYWQACTAARPYRFCVHWVEVGSVWAAASAPPSHGSQPRSGDWAPADSSSHNPPLLLAAPGKPEAPSCLWRGWGMVGEGGPRQATGWVRLRLAATWKEKGKENERLNMSYTLTCTWGIHHSGIFWGLSKKQNSSNSE